MKYMIEHVGEALEAHLGHDNFYFGWKVQFQDGTVLATYAEYPKGCRTAEDKVKWKAGRSRFQKRIVLVTKDQNCHEVAQAAIGFWADRTI